MRIAYKYSDRSSGPLGGKVTHTFLLINSPCRLADHSSVHSFKCFSHGPQLYVWFRLSLFISQPLKIWQGSTSSNWTEVWYILSASITLSVVGPTAKEAGSNQAFSPGEQVLQKWCHLHSSRIGDGCAQQSRCSWPSRHFRRAFTFFDMFNSSTEDSWTSFVHCNHFTGLKTRLGLLQ